MESSPLLLWFDLMGVFFFALSGNLLAARKDIDITGPCVISASAAAVRGPCSADLIVVGTTTRSQTPIVATSDQTSTAEAQAAVAQTTAAPTTATPAGRVIRCSITSACWDSRRSIRSTSSHGPSSRDCG